MNAIYIEVEANVRYWEDATINGKEDTEATLTPLKRGECWCPVIRLADGMVMEWPQGVAADIHFKVCDAGEYWLLDGNKQRIAEWGGYYVPGDFLCHGDEGYGDYIIMKIGADGMVSGWKVPSIEYTDDEDDQNAWKKIITPNEEETHL